MLENLKTRLSKVKWARVAYWSFVSALAISCLLLCWKLFKGSASPPATPPMRIAPESRTVSGLTKAPLSAPIVVQAYSKAAAVKRLQLPPEVADDPNQEVISTADLAPSRGGYVTATVLDTETGEAATRVTEKPRSLFELGGLTEIGLRYGITTRSGQQGALYARQDLLRISAVTVAGYGEVTAGTASQPEAKAMIDVKVAW